MSSSILGVSHLLWLPVAEKNAGSSPMTGINDHLWVVWRLSRHDTPCSKDSKLDLRSCRGTCFISPKATQLIGDLKQNDNEKAIYGLHYNDECTVCMIWKKAKRQTSIGFKVNLLSFDIFSGGHIYKLSKAGKGLLYTTLCIYTLQVWVASVTSL